MSLWLPIGHSLGASRCNGIAARGVAAGNAPAGGYRFGEPSTGFGKFNDLLRKISPSNFPSYRNMDANGHDQITDWLKYVPIAFPYEPPYPRTDVTQAPPEDDEWGPFKYHHAELYREALLKLNPIPVIAGISPIDAINLVVGLYAYPGSIPVTWDHLDMGADDGIVWAMKVVNGTKVFVFRGSVTPQDFIRDGTFPWQNDRDIGPIELGFNAGMHYVWEEMQPLLA